MSDLCSRVGFVVTEYEASRRPKAGACACTKRQWHPPSTCRTQLFCLKTHHRFISCTIDKLSWLTRNSSKRRLSCTGAQQRLPSRSWLFVTLRTTARSHIQTNHSTRLSQGSSTTCISTHSPMYQGHSGAVPVQSQALSTQWAESATSGSGSSSKSTAAPSDQSPTR